VFSIHTDITANVQVFTFYFGKLCCDNEFILNVGKVAVVGNENNFFYTLRGLLAAMWGCFSIFCSAFYCICSSLYCPLPRGEL